MKEFMRYYILIFLFLWSTRDFFAQNSRSQWVDSVYATLNVEERIGQVFMVSAYSRLGQKHWDDLALLVEEYHVGGVLFFAGTPYRQAKLTNFLQGKAKVPLLVGIDAEWGLSMRLDSTLRFPNPWTIGAIEDDSLIKAYGMEMGRQCRRLGIHVSFSPSADVNVFPNPVMGSRSMGRDYNTVARKSVALMQGMQQAGIIACAKHFPGHGNTNEDSHGTLPVIDLSKDELKKGPLYPFQALADSGVKGVMVGHLQLSAYEHRKNRACTVSKPQIEGLLRREMGFEGLVFTDALNMMGVSQFFPPGQLELEALKAGNDVLVSPLNVPKALTTIQHALQSGELDPMVLEKAVKRILYAKYAYQNQGNISFDSLNTDLNSVGAEKLRVKLLQASIKPIKGDFSVLSKDITDSIICLSINSFKGNTFQTELSKNSNVDQYAFKQRFFRLQKMEESGFPFKGDRLMIVCIHNFKSAKNLNPTQYSMMKTLQDNYPKMIVVLFGEGFEMDSMIDDFEYILWVPEDSLEMREFAAEYINSLKVE